MEDIREGTCPLCKHNEIVETWPRDQVGPGSEPLSAAERKTRWLGYMGLVGVFSALICRRCGYTQWFTSKPNEIPIDANQKTRLIKGPEPAGPYR